MKWVGHMVGMKDERLSKISETNEQEGCGKREARSLCEETSKKGRGGEKRREKTDTRVQWKK